jgi:hypothetical protein
MKTTTTTTAMKAITTRFFRILLQHTGLIPGMELNHCNVYRLVLLFFCLIPGTITLMAQSREDIIAVIKAVSEVPELDPLFQVELSEGRTMVLLKNDRLSAGSNEVERNYFNMTNDDLWGFRKPVKIMTQQEAGHEGVRRDQLITLGLSFSGDQCNARFAATVDEGSRYFEGWVSLSRSGFDWIVTGSNVRTR